MDARTPLVRSAALVACLVGFFAAEGFAQDRGPAPAGKGGAAAAGPQKPAAVRPREAGIVLAHFTVDCNGAEVKTLIAGQGGNLLGCLDAIGVCKIQFPAGKSEEAWSAALRAATNLCDWAAPNYECRPSLVSSDPYYGYQWHHAKIHSPAAWSVTTGSATVIVAVVDSGVDAGHPDLAGRVLSGWNTVSNNTNSAPANSHGTLSAGTIAAAGDNGVGVAGVAWKTKVLPIRVSNAGSGTAWGDDIAEGITWAADHGARVINVSMGPLNESIFHAAASYAEGKGAVVVVSAGNESTEYSTGYWPDYASMVFVSATGTSDSMASFSSYGVYVDCAAPGVSIMTTAPGGGYASVAGTSFSAPIVSGVFALVFAKNPGLTPAAAKSIVLGSCTDLSPAGEDKYYGKGRVDAAAALAATPLPSGTGPSPSPAPAPAPAPVPPDTTPPPVPTITTVVNPGTGHTLIVSWTASPAPDVAYYQVVRYVDTAGYTTLPSVPVGTTSVADTGLINGKDYWYFVRAVDSSGNKSGWSAYKGGVPTGP